MVGFTGLEEEEKVEAMVEDKEEEVEEEEEEMGQRDASGRNVDGSKKKKERFQASESWHKKRNAVRLKGKARDAWRRGKGKRQ